MRAGHLPLIGWLWGSLLGQAPVQPTFEVASIKLSPPPDGGRVFTGIRGGPGSSDPLHATFTRGVLGGFNLCPPLALHQVKNVSRFLFPMDPQMESLGE